MSQKKWAWEDLPAEALPEPQQSMSPEEKGALLLRYVAEKKFVAHKLTRDSWSRLDFVSAKPDLQGTRLHGADLTETSLQGVRGTPQPGEVTLQAEDGLRSVHCACAVVESRR